MYSGKFQNNSPISSEERLNFIEFQDVKLTKIEDFHKRDAADVKIVFTGILMRYAIT